MESFLISEILQRITDVGCDLIMSSNYHAGSSIDDNKYMEQLKMIFLLLSEGADPNIQDNGGHVALHSIRWDTGR